MDQDTLVNHIKNLSKIRFDAACSIILKDFFGIKAINVDGMNDGGADFIELTADGVRTGNIYQVTTQKLKIDRKLKNDAIKSIEKIKAKKFYFFTSTSVSETVCRKHEHDLSEELGIPVVFFDAKNVAAFLLDGNLLNNFLDLAEYPLPRQHEVAIDPRQQALYGYAVMSEDAHGMKQGIYDDTILYLLSDIENIEEDKLIAHVSLFLGVAQEKEAYIKKRIGALLSKSKIKKTIENLLFIDPDAMKDVSSRKRIYESELFDLASAQVDIMRNDFSVDWNLENSKDVSVYIANAYIARQIDLLSDINVSIPVNTIFKSLNKKGESEIKSYIKDKTRLSSIKSADAASALIGNASNHPLITKLARASIYVALDGQSPISSAKAFRASRWSDFNILIEPTVAIPWLCSTLYKGDVNNFFNIGRKSIERSMVLDCKIYIPFYYINECASHLLLARKYVPLDGAEGYEKELQYSPNAYIANYYSLKAKGERVPSTLIEYLKTFSPSVLIENNSWKEWVRSVMTDIQSKFVSSGVEFLDIPFYTGDDCIKFQREYAYYLEDRQQKKPRGLVDHDVWALQFTHDQTLAEKVNWAILTYDRSMLEIAKSAEYSGWIISPDKFLDLTNDTQPLSESRYVSLIHSLASSSEKTLSLGARIIDRVVMYASDELQNWEFKDAFETFKKTLLSNIDIEVSNDYTDIDKRVDEFLKSIGITVESVVDSDTID